MKRHASMNRIYRLVWSQVLNAWVAVSEIARGRGKRSNRRLIAVALSLTAAVAQAAPSGGQVVSGAGNITQSGATTTIQQSSQNLSLNWQSFNIASTENVNFQQPSAAAIAVNHIFDTNGTQILGHLNANGQVYLINPNGILFGQGAQVNVGGLVASTLDFNDASLNGTARPFSGNGTGSVINQGTITAATGGYVALLGNHVSNQGVITAQLGTVALGAGSAATLTFSGNSLVHLQVDQSVLNSLAENGGLIRADGGIVVMTAGAKDALLASVVNNTGVIEAHTVANQNGTITLLGGMQAGTVNVGGTLDASAPDGGNGGFIETSAAHVQVADTARVTTAAPNGKAGTWLIDPTNFTISSGGAAQTTSGIGASALEAALGTNGIVNIATSATANGSDLGDINVNANVLWSANQLVLTAHHDININAVMTVNNTASLDLEPASGNVNVALGASGFTGRVDFFQANGTTARSGTGFLTIGGIGYTVITDLGINGSSVTGLDLQGMNGSLINRSGHYALGGNIDAIATSGWSAGAGFTPIGGPGTQFYGTFNGLGHTISNLTINLPTTDNVGLFGYTAAGSSISNVGLVGGSVIGNNSVGGLVGLNIGTVSNSYATVSVTGDMAHGHYIGGLVGYNYNTVSNSHATGNVSGNYYVGGLVGLNERDVLVVSNGGTVSNSYATGNVTGGSHDALVNASTGADIGGLVGHNLGGTVSSSHATGNVSGNSSVGGLVGANGGTINYSYATTGTVSGIDFGVVGGWAGDGVGGLVGYNSGAVSNSYATGNVSSLSNSLNCFNIGGLVGANFGAPSSISNSYATGSVSGSTTAGGGVLGGLAGLNNGTVSNSYATGAVSGHALVGGLAGVNTGTVNNSFWDTTASGQATSAAGTGMTTAQMQTQANFTSATTANGNVNPGWDFGGTWVMYDGHTSPLLRSFMTALTVTANNASKTYDGLAYSGGNGLTYSSTPDANLLGLATTLSYSGTSQSATNVGSSYVITPGGLYSNQQGYIITYVDGALTITNER